MGKVRAVLAAAVLAGTAAYGIAASTGTALGVEALPLSAAHRLPITFLDDLLVDAANRHVLVTDPETGRLVVTNFGGTVLTVRDGLKGISGLALSADSRTLYAAQADARAIVAFDAKTVTEKARYPLGGQVHPHQLTVAGGKIWFGYQGDPKQDVNVGNFGSLDLSGAEPVVHLHDASTDERAFAKAPYVLSSPAAPNVLVVAGSSGERGVYSLLRVYDVSSGSEALTRTGWLVGNDRYGFPEGVQEVHLSADATQVLTASTNGVYRTPVAGSGYPQRVYGLWDSSTHVGIAADGRVAVGYPGGDHLVPDVYLYPAGSQTAEKTFSFPQVSTFTEMLHELAWGPGSERLFAVTRGGDYRLWTVQGTAFPTPAIKVTAPATATRGKALTVTGSTPLRAGSVLTVRRTDVDSPSGTVVRTVTTDAAGAFRLTDTPPAGGPVRYTASYAGSEDYNPAAGTATVQIPRTATTLALDKNKSVYAYGSTVTFTATLGSTYKNRTVEIWADPYGTEPTNRLKKATVNSAGKISATVKLTRNTKLTAKFTGDARYAPRSATSTVYTKAQVGVKVSRHYKTAKIGSTSYYHFKTSVDPEFTTTMTAYLGRRQRFVVQKYSGGKWKESSVDYFRLDAKGRSEIELEGTYDSGSRFRVRAEYVPGSSGDSVNYTTYGGWVYLTFKK